MQMSSPANIENQVVTINEVQWVNENLGETDHGQVLFKGATRRAVGKFARVSDKADPAKVYELLTKVWGMEKPQLLISVTGGAKSFNMDPKLKRLFASGLLKVAQTPGAWVITGGTNTGVMKHVGEALQGATKACIGIATWGILTNRNQLCQDENNMRGGKFTYSIASSLVQSGAFLDHNHTHFLLVDNGTTGKYGIEIPFRSAIEQCIMKSKKKENQRVPSVLLVLEGGPGTLGTVVGAIKGEQPVPVVIIKDSGRAADCIAYALEAISDDDLRIFNAENPHPDVKRFVKETFPEVKKDEEIDKFYNQVIECVSKRGAFTVFQMGSGAGVDEAILTALLSGHKTSPLSQLQLTLIWNRADLAQEKILSQPFTWQESDLNDTMIMALAMNRVDIVGLLLDHGISIPSLLTNDRLEFLYGYRSRLNTSTLRYEFDSSLYTKPRNVDGTMKLLCKFANLDLAICAIPRKVIMNCINRLCSCFVQQGTEEFIESIDSISSTSSYMEMNNAKQTFKHPFRELYVWAVCNNMLEMAMYLWGFEEEGIAKALVGSAISNSLAERAESLDLGEELLKSLTGNAQKFKDLALQLLDECFKTDETNTQHILTTQCEQFPMQTCLGLAVDLPHQEFVSHSATQVLLNDVWNGAIKQRDVTLIQVLLGVLFPPYVLYAFSFRTEAELEKMARADDYDEDESNQKEEENEEGEKKREEIPSASGVEENANNQGDSSDGQKKRLIEEKPQDYQSIAQPIDVRQQVMEPELPWYKKLIEFYFKTPVTKFFTNLIAYLVFLCLFAYVAILKKEGTKPAVAECVLIAFVVSLLTEEISQFIQCESPTFVGKLSDWSSNKWNVLDALAISLFFVALGLRLNSSTYAIGHLIYALDAGLWILRLLDVFYAHRILGPYVVMIYRMFIDMMHFMVILLVFLLSYGVSSAAILSPQSPGWYMLRDSFFHPYFNIYGELFIDRDPSNENTTRFGTPVIDSYSEPIAWALLGSYLLIANVLLMNLLIAIFNNTFTDVSENAAQIWKFERYHLIIEYANRPPLVPPFILLCHIYYAARWLVYRCSRCCKGGADTSGPKNDIQTHLSDLELQKISEFETDCIANLLRDQRKSWTAQSQEEMSKMVIDRVEGLSSVLVAFQGRLKKVENLIKKWKDL